MYEKLKRFLSDDTVYLSLLLVLVGIISFGLGRQSITAQVDTDTSRVQIEYPPLIQSSELASQSTENSVSGAENTVVVASKNGGRYHLPNCSGAKQIAERNLISFTSIAAAKAAGYTPAANCPGL